MKRLILETIKDCEECLHCEYHQAGSSFGDYDRYYCDHEDAQHDNNLTTYEDQSKYNFKVLRIIPEWCPLMECDHNINELIQQIKITNKLTT